MQKYVLIAAALQIAMVVTGHYNEFVLLNLSAVLGMAIPLVIAFVYGRGVTGVGTAAKGGAVIGFVGAFLGIGLAILLGDQTLMLLTFGPVSSALTGALGGAIGARMGAAS